MSNMYGLAIDNVVAYELVLPNGTVRIITRADEDLWFGLGGGFNNFVRVSLCLVLIFSKLYARES
jgi:hypothetical protein